MAASLSIFEAAIISASVVLCDVALCRFENQSSGKMVESPLSSNHPPEVLRALSHAPAKSESGYA